MANRTADDVQWGIYDTVKGRWAKCVPRSEDDAQTKAEQLNSRIDATMCIERYEAHPLPVLPKVRP